MDKEKQKNYNYVKLLIANNEINRFSDIFPHLKKSHVIKDMGINYARYNNLVIDVNGFKLEELYRLAELIGIDERKILDLAFANRPKKRK